MKEYLEFLSEEQTRKYLQDIKEFKKGAKNTLAKHNFKLIDQIIKDNFNNTPYSYNVIFSLGLTGLSNAIDTYDKDKGSFTSYASECIIANINDFLKKFPQTSLKAEGQRFAQTVIKELNLNVTSDQSPRLTNYIIDQFELYSSKQTKEILKLRYGFYERPYLEYQIAEKLKIEISEVIAVVMKYKSQIIKYAARLEISPQAIKSETLREKDVSKNIAPTITSTKNNKITEPTTIYEHAAQLGYSRKDTDILLDQCNDSKINLIKRLYGEDFCTLQSVSSSEKSYLKSEIRKIFVFKMTGKEKYQPRIKSLEERLSFATYEQIKAYVETLPLKQRKLIYEKFGKNLRQQNSLDKQSEQAIYSIVAKMVKSFDKEKGEFKHREPKVETLYSFLGFFGLTEAEVDFKYPYLSKDIQNQIKKLYGEDFCTLQSMNRNYQVSIRTAIKDAYGIDSQTGKRKITPHKSLLERLPETTLDIVNEIISTYSKESQDLLHQKFGEDLTEWNRLDYIDESRINNFLSRIKKDLAKREAKKEVEPLKPKRSKPAVSFELYLRRKGVPTEEVMKRYNDLKPREKETIKTLFGEDLSRYDISNADEKTRNQFYYIINKLKNGSKLPEPNESIYVTFNSFTKEEVDKALLSLAPETRELVYAYHGYDLENPIYVKLPNTMKKTIINIIYPRIRSLLQNPELIKKPEEKKLDLNELFNLAQVLAAKNLNNTFTNKELIIFALRVGIVEDGPYSIEKICLFFDLTAEQIQTITQKVMSKFKDNFDEIYDLIMSSLYKSQIKELKGNQIKPISREE